MYPLIYLKSLRSLLLLYHTSQFCAILSMDSPQKGCFSCMFHWLLTVTGANDTTGTWYGFWSGIGGDLFIFGGIYALYKKHNCHQEKCFRIGKHIHEGTPYCSKHHPEGR